MSVMDVRVCPDPTGALAKTEGPCLQRPCWCTQALVAGCTCGLYLDQIRRRAGHHSTDCKMIQERAR